MRERILVVEDDLAIAEPLARALEREGFAVAHVVSGEAALDALAADPEGDPFSLVLLDLGLPGIDGVEVCREIRNEHSACAVLMLTARSSELDEVLGLDAGADDYVTKPFSLAILTARVRALLRRERVDGEPALAPEPVIETGPVRVDPAAHRAWCNDRELELSPKQFDLLAHFVRHPGEALRREDIMSAVWDENWWGSTKTLDVHVGWLRQKLGAPDLISTVRGHGYRFDAS